MNQWKFMLCFTLLVWWGITPFKWKTIFPFTFLPQTPPSGHIYSYSKNTLQKYALKNTVDGTAFVSECWNGGFHNIQISPCPIISTSVNLGKSLKMIKHHNFNTHPQRGRRYSYHQKKCDVFNSVVILSSSWLSDPLATGVSYYFFPPFSLEYIITALFLPCQQGVLHRVNNLVI